MYTSPEQPFDRAEFKKRFRAFMGCTRTTSAFPTLGHRDRAIPGQAVASASEVFLLVIAELSENGFSTLVQHNIGMT